MIGIGLRKMLFWMTLLMLFACVYSLIYPPKCSNIDIGLYMSLFAIGPAILFLDAIGSVLRKKAKHFVLADSRLDGVVRREKYRVILLDGKQAVSLGAMRAVLPALTLAAYFFFMGSLDHNLPPC